MDAYSKRKNKTVILGENMICEENI